MKDSKNSEPYATIISQRLSMIEYIIPQVHAINHITQANILKPSAFLSLSNLII